MKRSEMIERMVSILRGCYPQYLDDQSNYSVRIDAEYVLDEIEKAGMLPSCNFDTEDGSMCGHELCAHWQPEEEE